MNESSTSEASRKSRIRWITLGEAIAIAALIVSAFGVWISWQGSGEVKGPLTTIVERRPVIPLTLRGTVQRDGRSMEISPIEDNHALQSLSITLPDARPIDLGSDGNLSAGDVESRLGKNAPEGKGTHRVRASIFARYVEAGADKSATGSYLISYRWDGGGLFGGRSLRIVGLSR
jgi:hypothetical protein